MASTCPAENYTVRLNTGATDPVLGMSYIQFAMEGLRHQLSQGAGGWSVEPGDRFTYYKLVESVLPPTVDKDGHEKDFFDGIDTSLASLASSLGEEEKEVQGLRPELKDIAEQTKTASARAEKDISEAAKPVFDVLQKLDSLILRTEKSNLSASKKEELLTALREKQEQAEDAVNLATNVSLEANVAWPRGPAAGLPREQDALTLLSPGQNFTIIVKLHNGAKAPLWIENASLLGPQDWITNAYKGDGSTIQPGEDFYANFALHVPPKVSYTRPALHRNDPERDPVYSVDNAKYATLPFPPPLFRARVNYFITGRRDLNLAILQAKPMRLKGTTGSRGRITSSVAVPFLDEICVEQ
jgi:hypothetical protein